MPVFANPLGLLALLGIPAVLAIHFLQRKAVELPVSTLFLLERTQRDAASGRRFDRLIPSIPLWMQLLAVLLLAWFLAEPRYQKSGSVQRVAVVVDSSASMQVFKTEAVARLTQSIPGLQGEAEQLEITLLESAPRRPRIYAGSSVVEMVSALTAWQPREGLVDPTSALRLARSLVSREGTVVYLTDTPQEAVPFDAKLLAVGEAIENVGFTGVSFSTVEGALVWRAMVRNYSDKPASRSWSLQSSAGNTEPRPVTIEPGGLITIQAAFPKNAKNVRAVLTADRFTLDDTLPMVAPAPKPLKLFTATSQAFGDLSAKLLRALDSAEPSQDAASADLSLVTYDPLDPQLPPGNSVVFVEDSTQSGAYLKGGIVAEPHPLMDGLNWQSLLVRETLELQRLPSDEVLLWQAKRPLIFLRRTAATETAPPTQQLCFNFDLRLSNAANQPAFIVCLHRFAESIREAKVAPQSLNLETGQPIEIATAPQPTVKREALDLSGKPMTSADFGQSGAAPLTPGFLTLRQGEAALLTSAVYFADTREADFSACSTTDTLGTASAAVLDRHTQPDPWWRVWILLLLAFLLVAWKYTAPSDAAPRAMEPTR
jgi:hypothetical protein